MEENKMFEDYKMHTEMEIRHHWVPMVLFERLIEKNPNGTYKGITNSTVVFQVEDENFTENWFLREMDCAEWYKQNETEPSVKTEEEEWKNG